MDRTGQGAIEYLLIIGAAILVVAVVIIALVSVTSGATDGTDVDQLPTLQKCQVDCLNQKFDWNSINQTCSGTIVPSGNYDCTSYN
ncbi:MAG: hypothetical protein PHX27_00515 [Candidatus ainarchaeum sp.]|nr:hypothetical protein [Candidatus ainarchaeum sp.]